jgi:hypothetical protein
MKRLNETGTLFTMPVFTMPVLKGSGQRSVLILQKAFTEKPLNGLPEGGGIWVKT